MAASSVIKNYSKRFVWAFHLRNAFRLFFKCFAPSPGIHEERIKGLRILPRVKWLSTCVAWKHTQNHFWISMIQPNSSLATLFFHSNAIHFRSRGHVKAHNKRRKKKSSGWFIVAVYLGVWLLEWGGAEPQNTKIHKQHASERFILPFFNKVHAISYDFRVRNESIATRREEGGAGADLLNIKCSCRSHNIEKFPCRLQFCSLMRHTQQQKLLRHKEARAEHIFLGKHKKRSGGMFQSFNFPQRRGYLACMS